MRGLPSCMGLHLVVTLFYRNQNEKILTVCNRMVQIYHTYGMYSTQETLEQMFHVFKVNSEDQQYQLDVLEKLKETFQLRLEMKNFKDNEKVIDNFRRQGDVQGGGCVKFFRKFL